MGSSGKHKRGYTYGGFRSMAPLFSLGSLHRLGGNDGRSSSRQDSDGAQARLRSESSGSSHRSQPSMPEIGLDRIQFEGPYSGAANLEEAANVQSLIGRSDGSGAVPTSQGNNGRSRVQIAQCAPPERTPGSAEQHMAQGSCDVARGKAAGRPGGVGVHRGVGRVGVTAGPRESTSTTHAGQSKDKGAERESGDYGQPASLLQRSFSLSSPRAAPLEPSSPALLTQLQHKDSTRLASRDRYLGRPSSPNIMQRPYREVSVRYEIGKKIGSGTFGTVSRCVDRLTGEVLACKSIQKSQLACYKDLEAVRMEVQVLEAVGNHPAVVTLKGVYEDPKSLHLVMELCEGGELFNRLRQRKCYPEGEAAEVCLSLVSVLAFCHQRGIMHRDLKPENILLAARGDDTRIRVADFGQAATFQPGTKLKELLGSVLYIAPEVLQQSYGPEADFWSLGVTLFVLLAGVPPFWGETKSGIYEHIASGRFDMESGRWRKVSKEAKDLVRRLLTTDPAERIAAEEVKSHPWILRHSKRPAPPLYLEPDASSDPPLPLGTLPSPVSSTPASPTPASRSPAVALAGSRSVSSSSAPPVGQYRASKSVSHLPSPTSPSSSWARQLARSDSDRLDLLPLTAPLGPSRALCGLGGLLPRTKPPSPGDSVSSSVSQGTPRSPSPRGPSPQLVSPCSPHPRTGSPSPPGMDAPQPIMSRQVADADEAGRGDGSGDRFRRSAAAEPMNLRGLDRKEDIGLHAQELEGRASEPTNSVTASVTAVSNTDSFPSSCYGTPTSSQELLRLDGPAPTESSDRQIGSDGQDGQSDSQDKTQIASLAQTPVLAQRQARTKAPGSGSFPLSPASCHDSSDPASCQPLLPLPTLPFSSVSPSSKARGSPRRSSSKSGPQLPGSEGRDLSGGRSHGTNGRRALRRTRSHVEAMMGQDLCRAAHALASLRTVQLAAA